MSSCTGLYAKPWEMFARAFEGWVYDKLALDGAQNQFLVSDRIKEGEATAAQGYKGSIYLEGQERINANKIFDDLVKNLFINDKGVLDVRSEFADSLEAENKNLEDIIQSALDTMYADAVNVKEHGNQGEEFESGIKGRRGWRKI